MNSGDTQYYLFYFIFEASCLVPERSEGLLFGLGISSACIHVHRDRNYPSRQAKRLEFGTMWVDSGFQKPFRVTHGRLWLAYVTWGDHLEKLDLGLPSYVRQPKPAKSRSWKSSQKACRAFLVHSVGFLSTLGNGWGQENDTKEFSMFFRFFLIFFGK